MGETLYTIGTDQQQAWMKKNCFPPRGYGYSEPGTYSLDATEVAAYNVAKSFYQVYPEVWNIDYIEKEDYCYLVMEFIQGKSLEANPMISRID